MQRSEEKPGMIGDLITFLSAKMTVDADFTIDSITLNESRSNVDIKSHNDSIMNRSISIKNTQRGNKLYCKCSKLKDADIFCSRAREWYSATLSKKNEQSAQGLQA